MNSNDLTCKVEGLSVLLQHALAIPPYQRPYKWQKKHIVQLLEDIYESYINKKRKYRIGSVILHQTDAAASDIVDGQQRLITVSIILYHLSGGAFVDSKLLKVRFPHEASVANIVRNHEIIVDWFSLWNEEDKQALGQYFLHQCEVVVIRLQRLEEAFQLFDAQNARGKTLEPYDLLKAYHLREMRHNTDKEKLACVKRWEADVYAGRMVVLGTYLYRIRKWANGKEPAIFSKDDTDEFKGVNLSVHRKYPYLKPVLLNNAMLAFMDGAAYPYQITQPILNGKCFFGYVAHYIDQYTALFGETIHPFSVFYRTYCREYDGANRLGDTFVREMYEALVMLYKDKFGEAGFTEVWQVLYKWSYTLRLQQFTVRYDSVNKYIREQKQANAFEIIHNALHPAPVKKIKVVQKKWERHIDPIITLFETKPTVR